MYQMFLSILLAALAFGGYLAVQEIRARRAKAYAESGERRKRMWAVHLENEDRWLEYLAWCRMRGYDAMEREEYDSTDLPKTETMTRHNSRLAKQT